MRKHVIADEVIRDDFKYYLRNFCGAVISTMGPYGRTVAIENGNAMPIVTKDGVTVAKKLQSTDKVENMVFSIAKQACLETLKEAGDGTTSTAAILLGLSDAYDSEKDKNPNKTKKALAKDVERITKELKAIAIETNSDIIKDVIKTSSNNDEVVIDAMVEALEVTQNISISEYPSHDTYVEVKKGYEIETAILNSNLTSEGKGNQCIVITDEISKSVSLDPIIEQLEELSKSYTEILWVHNRMDKKLFSEVVRRTSNVFPITIDGVGGMVTDYLYDLAVYTDAKVYGVNDVIKPTLCNFTVNGFTTIESLSHNENRIRDRISSIEEAIRYVESEYVKRQYRKRIAKIQGISAVIHFKSRTESAFIELLDRADDALRAVQSALVSGVVPGGATTYVRLASVVETDLLLSALTVPYEILLESAGIEESHILHDGTTGEPALTYGKNQMVDLDTGEIVDAVYDPALVVESAIKNAVSAFSTLITTTYSLINVVDKTS